MCCSLFSYFTANKNTFVYNKPDHTCNLVQVKEQKSNVFMFLFSSKIVVKGQRAVKTKDKQITNLNILKKNN